MNSKMRRSNQRGAAMVEAALTMPILVLFLGYLASFHGLHSKTFEVMAEARRVAWAEATHTGCNGNPAPHAIDPAPLGKGQKAAGAGGGTTSKLNNHIVNVTHATKTGTSTAAPLKTTIHSWTITADSFVFCNEDVDPTAGVLTQMWNLATSFGSGILN